MTNRPVPLRVSTPKAVLALLSLIFTAPVFATAQQIASVSSDSAAALPTLTPMFFGAAAAQPTPPPPPTGVEGFIAHWQARVTATQNNQPHWITPLVTVTPRLEQEFRTDFVRQINTKGYDIWNLGNSKGLELIPWRNVEILVNVPPFIDHTQPKEKDGFGDMSFNSKYRILSKNEEHGDYILTAFFAATIPTGKNGNGSCCAVVTPTLAGGKGWGLFDIESTLGGSLPITNSKGLGHTIAWNNTLQYRLAKTGAARLFWPEVEFNSSFFKGGANDGKSTTYATPGMVVGRVPLTHDASGKPGRLGLTFGVGEQIALSEFHSTNHNLVFTARLPF